MAVEQRSPAVCKDSNKKEGKGDMTKIPISLQDLRRSLYIKAKTEPVWRFWGLYVHVCKMDTLREAYLMAKKNDGAPGIDGVTFEAIEESGVESFLQQIRDGLVSNTYRPMRARKKEIPKDGGTKVRVLSIPSIRDRVVQGALKLILEPIFEADFQPGSYGYRPKRTAHEAVYRVAQAIDQSKTSVIDLDLRAYFDNVQHSLLLEKVARRVQDDDVMRLLKMILKATVWLARAVEKRLREELVKLKVEINEEKSKIVDLANGGSFTFLGFEYRRIRGRNRKWRAYYAPKVKKRTALVAKLKEIFRQNVSQPVEGVIEQINPILRGWVNYFALGDSSECFSFIRDWVEKKIRGHLMRARERSGFGWNRWSRKWLYRKLGLYSNYRLRRPWTLPKSQVAESVT
jgi:RNA-directed DNA polymerase